MIENGEISPQPIILKLPIEKLATYKNYSIPTRLVMMAGSENFAIVSNSVISASAVLTFGMSGIGLSTTTNLTAKTFYAMSCAFSSTSAVTGSMAVLVLNCKVSEVALLTETFGGAFLFLGNSTHAAALKIEERPVIAGYKRPIAGLGLYNRGNNVAFTTPFKCSEIIQTIPFE